MREILFRGKRIDDGEWAYGLLFGDKEKYISRGAIERVFTNGNIEVQAIDVIPETVGEFTGLTDKNGTKIFEGDIIKFCKGLKKTYFVEFDSGRFVLTRKDAHCELFEISICPCEVIGNIHDKPELLGVSEK